MLPPGYGGEGWLRPWLSYNEISGCALQAMARRCDGDDGATVRRDGAKAE